jgi:hypothetical protein
LRAERRIAVPCWAPWPPCCPLGHPRRPWPPLLPDLPLPSLPAQGARPPGNATMRHQGRGTQAKAEHGIAVGAEFLVVRDGLGQYPRPSRMHRFSRPDRRGHFASLTGCRRRYVGCGSASWGSAFGGHPWGVAARTPLVYGLIFYAMPAVGLGLLGGHCQSVPRAAISEISRDDVAWLLLVLTHRSVPWRPRPLGG